MNPLRENASSGASSLRSETTVLNRGPSHPISILEETVQEVAATLRKRLDQIPGDVLRHLPDLMGVSPSWARAAQGFAQLRLSGDQPTRVQAGRTVGVGNKVIPFKIHRDTHMIPGSWDQLNIPVATGLDPMTRRPTLTLQFQHALAFRCIPELRWIPCFFEMERSWSDAWSQAEEEMVAERWNGHEWIALEFKDETLGLRRSGFVWIDGHAFTDEDLSRALTLEPAPVGDQSRGHWIRMRGPAAERFGEVRAVRLNVVAITNHVEIEKFCLGSGNGLPHQKFVLRHEGQILQPMGPFKVVVESGKLGASQNDERTWTEVPSFFLSGPQDRHFVLERNAAQLIFGDGQLGRVIPPGFDNLWVQGLKACHGEQGNLPRNSAVLLGKRPGEMAPFSEGRLVADCGGGQDAPSYESSMMALRSWLTTQDRAVTLQDYVTLVKSRFGNLDRVWAHAEIPTLGSEHSARTVTLTVVESVKNPATLDPALQRAIVDWLEPRRLINTRVVVRAPSVRHIRLQARMTARADGAKVRVRLEHFLNQLCDLGLMLKVDLVETWAMGADLGIENIREIRWLDLATGMTSAWLKLELYEVPAWELDLKIEEAVRPIH
jgi:hypothetical protein